MYVCIHIFEIYIENTVLRRTLIQEQVRKGVGRVPTG